MSIRDLFAGIIDNLLEGVILLDKDKRVNLWNRWIEQTSGISSENATGKSLLDLFPDIQYTRIDACIDQVLIYGQSSFISHTINPIMFPLFYDKDGKEKTKVYHNIRITSLGASNEESVVMIYVTDETANVLKEKLLRKKALEEKRLNEKLLSENAERRQIEEKLKLNSSVIANTREGVVITDPDAIIESVNPAFIEITGYEEADVLGKHIRILKSGKHTLEFYKSLWEDLKSIGHWKGEFINKKPDNSLIIIESSITAIRNREGEISNYVSIFHDITQRKKYEEMLEIRSKTDPLTRLFNRGAFNEALATQWRVCVRHGLFIGIIMIDVDYFKDYNDTYGHQAGDECLIKIAAVLRANVRRADDIIARFGGEEFVLVLTGIDEDGVRAVSDAILHDVESLKIQHGESKVSKYVTISAGIGMSKPWVGLTAEKLIEAADKALYKAKKSGRNQKVVQTLEQGPEKLNL